MDEETGGLLTAAADVRPGADGALRSERRVITSALRISMLATIETLSVGGKGSVYLRGSRRFQKWSVPAHDECHERKGGDIYIYFSLPFARLLPPLFKRIESLYVGLV